MYEYIVLLHVVGAFLFALSHGVSLFASLQLRATHERAEITALLKLSQVSLGGVYVGLLLLLVGGVWAGFAGDHWGSGWIWASLGTLVVVIVAMYAMATPFYGRMRVASGVTTDPKMVERIGELGPEELATMAASGRPLILAAIGGIGFLVILWLMVVKPF